MFDITLTPEYSMGDSGHLFDVIIGWTEYGERVDVRLSELIFLSPESFNNPQRRLEVYEDALRGFSFFGAMLGRAKETLTHLELRFERWQATIRPAVRDYLQKSLSINKPTIADIDTGMVSLNAVIVPPCFRCGNKSTHFLVSTNVDDETNEALYHQKGKHLGFICDDHFEHYVKTGVLVEDIFKLPSYLETSLIDFEPGFIYEAQLTKLGYVVTGYIDSTKYVNLGDIWESFQDSIRHFESLINGKNNSRGALEILVKAFEKARDQNIDMLRFVNSEFQMRKEE